MLEADSREGRLPWAALLVLGLPTLLLLAGPWLGVPRLLAEALAWIEVLGPRGELAFVALYVLVTVAGLPVTWLVVTGGVFFGAARGLALVTLGGMLGASLAFWIARRVGRQQALRWLAARSSWRRLEPLVRAHAGPMVAVIRFLPGIPFSLQNYALGLSGIPFRVYFWWTLAGILPAGAFAVVGAEAVTEAILGGRGALALAGVAVLLGPGMALLVGLARRFLTNRPPP